MRYDERQYLLGLGMKDKLLELLNKDQKQKLAEFAMDNHGKSDILPMLISLASLEGRGKIGVIFLVAKQILTTRQAKNLSSDQINQIVDTYNTIEHDELENMKNARMQARQFIVSNQELKSDHERSNFEQHDHIGTRFC